MGLATEAIAAKRPEITGCRLGLGDRYKLGCWAPVRLGVTGGDEPLGVSVVAIAPDSDGSGVATTVPGGRPLSTEPGRTSEATLYARIGRAASPLLTRLVAGGRVVAERRFSVDYNQGYLENPGEVLSEGISSTSRLYLQLSGPSQQEGSRMLLNLETLSSGEEETSAAFVQDPAELPQEAIGYDSFDAVLLIAGGESGGSQPSWLAGLSAGDRRLEALVAWVRSGGRLVVSCGSAGEALLGPGGPLAELCPGEFVGNDSLASASAIVSYTDPPDETPAIDLGGVPLRVSKIAGARGVVEAFGGRDRSETPLIVKTPLGFGEVTFVAFDLDAPAIAAWPGRTALLKRLLQHRALPEEGYYWHSPDVEFVYRLTDLLDQSFSGVKTAPFLLVVGLVLGYLMLIGPGDYFFVKNVLKRVEATWVTFPLIVVLTSAAAYAGAYWLKGDKLRISRVEVIDIEASTGVSRGSLFTHLFSPRSRRYDVSLVTESLASEPTSPEMAWTAGLGKPGWGLGSMSGAAAQVRSADYRLDTTPLLRPAGVGSDVSGLPVQVWSTKTLVSRYLTRVDRSVDSQLTPDGEGLVVGAVTNDTGADLYDCWLLYGTWAWPLGTLTDGETTAIDPSVNTLKITTMQREQTDSSSLWWAVQEATLSERQEDWSQVSRYLGDLDLSHRLDAGDALLIATARDGPRSQLVGPEGRPLIDSSDDPGDDQSDKSWVFVRVVLPVGEQPE